MRRVATSLTGRHFDSLHHQRWASSESGGWFQSLWKKKDVEGGEAGAGPVDEHGAPEADSQKQESAGNSWIPNWMKSKLPGILGGTKDFDELKNMNIDAYAKQLSRARGMSGLSGALGMDTRLQSAKLKRSEDIISLMNDVEKTDPVNTFKPAARRRIAKEVGCTPGEVDDCINSYVQMKFLGDIMVQRKEQGKPMPTNVEELQSIFAESKTEMQAAMTPRERSDVSGKRNRFPSVGVFECRHRGFRKFDRSQGEALPTVWHDSEPKHCVSPHKKEVQEVLWKVVVRSG